MHIIGETVDDGVIARRFDLQVGDETVPGMHWIPTHPATATYPTICIAHGGFQHKLHSNVPELRPAVRPQSRRRRRRPRRTQIMATASSTRRRRKARRAAMVASHRRAAAQHRPRTRRGDGRYACARHTVEWAAHARRPGDRRPLGGWTIRLVGCVDGDLQRDPRRRRRTRGSRPPYSGSTPLQPTNEDDARAITIPLLFLNQSDDELMTRDAALALWDAFGSSKRPCTSTRVATLPCRASSAIRARRSSVATCSEPGD